MTIMSLQAWLQTALGMIFPLECLRCQLPLNEGVAVAFCDECQIALMGEPRRVCLKCGEQLPHGFVPETPLAACPTCRLRPQRFDETAAIGRYDGPLRDAVLQTKQAAQGPLTAALADLLLLANGPRLRSWQPDLIVPVPMHWARRAARLTNGPEVLATRLGETLGVPVARRLLVRRRWTVPQGPLSPPARKRNVHGAFVLRGPWNTTLDRKAKPLKGQRVLIVDDVLTSGATASEMAKLLKRFGASFVALAVLARAESA